MAKKFFIILVLIMFFIIVFVLNPLHCKKKILSVNIPNSDDEIELWEEPRFDLFTFNTEYETWFVFRASTKRSQWFLIHERYITFGKISVFIYSNLNQIRIETNEIDSEKTHLIAEYNIKKNSFLARSDETVRFKQDWMLLIEKRVR